MSANEIRFYRARGEYGFLSNLYVREISFSDRKFRSAEDAYQFGKPRDIKVAEWLISAPKPHLCAAAAHALLGSGNFVFVTAGTIHFQNRKFVWVVNG